jgi:transposase
MITASNEQKLQALPEHEGIKIISALTHREIVDLLARTNHEAELFDDRNIVEITDPSMPGHRYCLCRNPHSAQRETTTRNELLERTRKELNKIVERKRPAEEAVIGARVGKILAKTKMGKYLKWSVKEGRLVWSVDEAAVNAAQAMDGCYVIKTTVSAEAMTKDQVVAHYKSLGQVEQAFRNMKKVSLEMRPMHHKRDDRIRAHVFLCMLAYYLQWHLWGRLKPLFDEQAKQISAGEKENKERSWTLENVLSSLKSIQRNEVEVAGAKFYLNTKPDAEAERLLALLKISLPKL